MSIGGRACLGDLSGRGCPNAFEMNLSRLFALPLDGEPVIDTAVRAQSRYLNDSGADLNKDDKSTFNLTLIT